MRRKDVSRAQLGIFILPVTSSIAFGAIPAFSGQSRAECKSERRKQTEDVAKLLWFPVIPMHTGSRFPMLLNTVGAVSMPIKRCLFPF